MARILTVLVAVALFGVLTLCIVEASGVEDVITGFGHVLELPWGRVGLLDLYIGLILVGAWIHVLEGHWGRSVIWWTALFFLGNGAAVAYVGWRALRLPSFRAIFTEPRRTHPPQRGRDGSTPAGQTPA